MLRPAAAALLASSLIGLGGCGADASTDAETSSTADDAADEEGTETGDEAGGDGDGSSGDGDGMSGDGDGDGTSGDGDGDGTSGDGDGDGTSGDGGDGTSGDGDGSTGDGDGATGDGDGTTGDGDGTTGDGDGTTGDGDGTTGDGDGDGFELAPTSEVLYVEDTTAFPNPERGIYRFVVLTDGADLSWVYDEGRTLVFSYVRLDAHRTEPIPQSLLDALIAGLAQARAAGVKVVLRFAYNAGPWPNSEPDAPLAWVLSHIAQVQPILQSDADVLAVVQAGFIGAWGEWHTSTNNLLDDKDQILTALLDAIPPSRMSQLRYPPHKDELFGGPLDATTGLSGSHAARVGHHNDCFLASDTDLGTYPVGEEEQWKTFVEAETLYVPMGGETCADNPPRSSCPTALAEMERLRYTYLNLDWHPDVITRWQNEGCFDTIERSMGYRHVLRRSELPSSARPGGRFDLRVELDNVGWASMFNARDVVLTLDGPGGAFEASLVSDPRRWLAGQTEVLTSQVSLPTGLAEGDYSLSLWLPDPFASIRDRPEYAVRLANVGTWDAGTARNRLGTITIDDTAPGSSASGQGFTVD